MDVLTSSEFRKRYASLLRATTVTVNGHVIGTWTPARGIPEGYHEVPVEEVEPTTGLVRLANAPGKDVPVMIQTAHPFEPDSVRAFTAFRPVPKPSRRK